MGATTRVIKLKACEWLASVFCSLPVVVVDIIKWDVESQD